MGLQMIQTPQRPTKDVAVRLYRHALRWLDLGYAPIHSGTSVRVLASIFG
jgi:hypothetical protein